MTHRGSRGSLATGVLRLQDKEQAAYLCGILTGSPGPRAGPTVVRYTTKTRNYAASQVPCQGPGSLREPEAEEQRN